MEPSEGARFEAAVLPHLNAAHNLACHITSSTVDADDIVQDACLRALKHFGGFTGTDARSWFLVITRNASYDFLRRQRGRNFVPLDDAPEDSPALVTDDVHSSLERELDWARLDQAMQSLPPEFREVIVLRELEGFSYAQIASATGLPAGTVMSRISRARRRLRDLLSTHSPEVG